MGAKYQNYEILPDEGLLAPRLMYPASVRIWHWSNALMVLVLSTTGYLIGTPFPGMMGDPSELYLMGYVRFLHLAGGYLFTVLFLWRIWLAITAGGAAHQLFLPAFWQSNWTVGLLRQIAWNLLLPVQPFRYYGLNPLGNLAMLFLFILPAFVLILTGFAMLAEVAGHESWQYALFGWLTLWFGNTIDLHTMHRLAMWVIIAFAMMHIYVAVREDVLGRQTMISTMISGERVYRE